MSEQSIQYGKGELAGKERKRVKTASDKCKGKARMKRENT